MPLPQYAHGNEPLAWRTMIASQSAQNINKPDRVSEWTRLSLERGGQGEGFGPVPYSRIPLSN